MPAYAWSIMLQARLKDASSNPLKKFLQGVLTHG